MDDVLVYRIGSLGDTLVAVPALRAVRAHFARSKITYLCDRHVGQSYVLGSELLAGSGLVDAFLDYPLEVSRRGRWLQPFRMARLLASLRRRRFSTLVYLAPTNRPAGAVARDRRFFRAAGIATMIGFEGFMPFPETRPPEGFAAVPHEADLLLARLRAAGLAVPEPGTADVTLPIGDDAREAFARWRGGLPDDGGRTWVSTSPGGKQAANRWPIERYEEVLRTLVARWDIWPVVFGGPQDVEDAHRLVRACGRGHIAAGMLSLPAAVHAMGRCALHVGNDTGTMHMAAAAGIPCVGVYSSRNFPGLFYPYGPVHRVLRTPIDCENCELFVCVDRGMECILAIRPASVIAACDEILSARASALS